MSISAHTHPLTYRKYDRDLIRWPVRDGTNKNHLNTWARFDWEANCGTESAARFEALGRE
ncbi:MAG: hypothetical protein C0478_09420 [Planctomyces sp.]|nr:hypothetical protein [Planctomyces sp.]